MLREPKGQFAQRSVRAGAHESNSLSVLLILALFVFPLGALSQTVTGQWDFELGDLRATIGSDLSYVYMNYEDRPAFGTTTEFGISDFDSVPARVMRMPACSPTMRLTMPHGAGPNGGGVYVNEYTLIMDLLSPSESMGKWRALFQTSTNSYPNDGDLFVSPADGIGISGGFAGLVRTNTWQRFVFAFDLKHNLLEKYLDGVYVGSQTLSEGLDGRWSLNPTALLFADDDGETAELFVNSIQFRDYRLSSAEILALGPASAGGIPLPAQGIPPQGVTGQWDFDHGDLWATIGFDMKYVGWNYEGHPMFGTTAEFSVADFGGVPARVMWMPACSPTMRLTIPHGARPNGGGAFVNEYTLVMDLLFSSKSMGKWRALFQANTNNANDSDLFVSPADGIGILGDHVGLVKTNTWQRFAFAFDLRHSLLEKYLDGVYVGSQTLSEGLDGRWSLDPTALLFADDDGETAQLFVNSVQFRDYRLSSAEVLALGPASAGGIPLPAQGTFNIARISRDAPQASVTLTWMGADSNYRIDARNNLNSDNWSPVVTVTNDNSITLGASSSQRFYRVVRLP